MAIPPEVLSQSLNSGPGAGGLLRSAAQWQQLSDMYKDTLVQMQQILTETSANIWEGATAIQYRSVHEPYLAWLEQVSIESESAAMQLGAAANSYCDAVATMPSLAEITTNRITHDCLIATNFFGINCAQICLTEIDYARMWLQAAATMEAYQAEATTAVSSVPMTVPADRIYGAHADGLELVQDLPPWLAKLIKIAISALKTLANLLINPYPYLVQFFEFLGLGSEISNIFALVCIHIYYFGLPTLAGLLSLLPSLSALSVINCQTNADSPQPNIDPAHGTENIYAGGAQATSDAGSNLTNALNQGDRSGTALLGEHFGDDGMTMSHSIDYLARPPDGSETPAIDSFNKPPGVLNEYSTVLATRTLKATSPEHDVIADKKTRARKFRYEFTELPSDTQIIGRTGAVRPSTEAQKWQPHTTSYVGASVGALIESTEPLLPQTWTGSLQQDAFTGNEHN